MDDIESPSAMTIGELSRIVKEFVEKIQNGRRTIEKWVFAVFYYMNENPKFLSISKITFN